MKSWRKVGLLILIAAGLLCVQCSGYAQASYQRLVSFSYSEAEGQPSAYSYGYVQAVSGFGALQRVSMSVTVPTSNSRVQKVAFGAALRPWESKDTYWSAQVSGQIGAAMKGKGQTSDTYFFSPKLEVGYAWNVPSGVLSKKFSAVLGVGWTFPFSSEWRKLRRDVVWTNLGHKTTYSNELDITQDSIPFANGKLSAGFFFALGGKDVRKSPSLRYDASGMIFSWVAPGKRVAVNVQAALFEGRALFGRLAYKF